MDVITEKRDMSLQNKCDNVFKIIKCKYIIIMIIICSIYVELYHGMVMFI